MNDELDPGPPPPELKGLLMEHLLTGEPTRAELDRVGRAMLQPRAPLDRRPTRTRRVPPELIAVAAVLTIVIGATLIVWKVRTQLHTPEATVDQGLFVVLEAGDLERANELLAKCERPECETSRQELARLARKVGEGVPVVADDLRVLAQYSAEPLDTDQILSSLNGGPHSIARWVAQLEREGVSGSKATLAANAFARAHRGSVEGRREALLEVLSAAPGTTLARQAQVLFDGLADAPDTNLAAPIASAEVEASQATLLASAERQLALGANDEAIDTLERCLALPPRNVECVVRLASAYARRGSKTGDAADDERAIALYEEFLRNAPSGHPKRSRVKALLEAARGTDQPARRSETVEPFAKEPEVTDPLTAKKAGDTQLTLLVGSKTRLTAEGAARIAIGDPTVVDVRAEATGLVLEGISPGSTTMLIWTSNGERKTYTITVSAR